MSIYVSKNFKYSEFACPCCGKDRPIDPQLIFLLQNLREKIDRPIYISKGGGLRCKKYNKRIGGYVDSPHVPFLIIVKGEKVFRGCKAADIHAKNMDIISIAKQAKDIGFSRIGLYPFNHFVHVDIIRPYPSASWVRDVQGRYVYFKSLDGAMTYIKDHY